MLFQEFEQVCPEWRTDLEKNYLTLDLIEACNSPDYRLIYEDNHAWITIGEFIKRNATKYKIYHVHNLIGAKLFYHHNQKLIRPNYLRIESSIRINQFYQDERHRIEEIESQGDFDYEDEFPSTDTEWQLIWQAILNAPKG